MTKQQLHPDLKIGAIGEYGIYFTVEGITPQDYMDRFYAGNIKSMTITEYEATIINKQDEEIAVGISNFGLNTIEHLDEMVDAESDETYHPNGW